MEGALPVRQRADDSRNISPAALMTTTSDLIAGLSDSRAYPFQCDRVDVRQTPSSILFFAGDRVYKVKKAVDLGFLDFTTLARRLFYCQEEVRLNSRLSPEVYLGVVAIAPGPDGGLRVAALGGPAIEYAVEMKRLPERDMLDRRLDAGEVDDAMLDALTDRLIKFHREAPTGPGVNQFGQPDAVAAMVLGNLDEAARYAAKAGTLSAGLHRLLERAARGFLEARRDLLAARVASGRIREGHGDLHAGNICITAEGIVIYDCIEFSPQFRCGDVARDLAFLIMDLEERGQRGPAAHVTNRYATLAADGDLETLLPFYKAHLACVRGKVNAITAADPGVAEPERPDARRASFRYFSLAGAYGLPPSLVVTCGLPGSGKSWLADRVARPLDAAIVRSDVVRKRLAGIAPTLHPTGPEAEALYSARSSQRTYEAMVQEAQAALAGGRSVVVDATFPQRLSRATFARLAESRRAPFVLVHVTAPEPVVAQRLRRRPDLPEEVSDAGWEVYLKFKRTFEPPWEIPPAQLVVASSPGEAEPIVAVAVEKLLGQAQEKGA
jgi:aminoglycoside phosphotransferase family enzyme/predicted kinase